ncbi:MAG TPA: ABC transporter ATP-binding protein [Trebonia sp.]|jgi:peptide/nickel transport system ATP-binding protein|nr:ABC transporter ATP-binding protein [Trebonia sp.]
MSSGDTAMDATAAPPAADAADRPLIELVNVSKHYRGSGLTGQAGAPVLAVAGVDLAVPPGASVGIVGESGCGKSTLGRVVVGLEKPTGGAVLLRGKRVADMGHGERRASRREIQMMFQDPYAALNPRMTLDRIIEEPLRARGGISRTDRRDRVRRLADEVGISAAQLGRYPRELSGGQRQRVGLARALATNPALIVADEPVSALDVSVRSQILNLMASLQAEHNIGYLMISHDLTVIHYFTDHVVVMYLGKFVESGPPEELFRSPAHHYTQALIDAAPDPVPGRATAVTIRGELPSAAAPPSGCRFRTRCPAAQDRCAEEEPVLRAFGPAHQAACHFPLKEAVPA